MLPPAPHRISHLCHSTGAAILPHPTQIFSEWAPQRCCEPRVWSKHHLQSDGVAACHANARFQQPAFHLMFPQNVGHEEN